MQFNPLSFLLPIVGALIVAGLLAWVRRPRLVVLVPNMFSYSEITRQGGQVVEITVFNRGFKTEEVIDVTLNPRMSYEVLGANSQDVSVEQNRMKITRIAPSDEVSALLIVENGDFKPDDIIQTTSKETKGVRVKHLADVPPTGTQRAFLLAVFVGFPAVMYAGWLGLDWAFNKPLPPAVAAIAGKSVDAPAKSDNWIIGDNYRSLNRQLFQDVVGGKVKVIVGSPTRKGDVATIPFKLTNTGTQTVEAMISVNSNATGTRSPSGEARKSGIFVRPRTTEERLLKVIIPAKATSIDDRTVYMEAFLESITGDSLQMKQAYVVGE
jgi:hypothetical protein